MDDVRFDRLTRALATGASRRTGIRLLAGAGAALLALARSADRDVSARHALLGPGDPCRDSSQCLAADAPLICADNGFTFDGPLNCCTYVGSRCGSDQGCCGTAACIDGFCDTIQDVAGPGDRCRDSSVCVGADAPLTCDFVAVTGDYRCCTYEGSRCGFDAACCGAAACVNGYCANIVTDAGVDFAGPGDPCQYGYQCVAADTALTCDYVAATDDYRCCAVEGSRCGWDGGCCGWLRCGADGFCTGAPPFGCNGEGCDCDFHDPNACAPGLVCCAVQSGFICATWANCGG
ncbi:MAG: hypothetical protein KY456_12185 [Chloroflexi bacterium]|nr:hypothetical protein [Chloroflexota bacterium]